jgi:paraquat-inducible protein B
MAEPERVDDEALPPEVARSRAISLVWLVPLVAVVAGLWLLWEAYWQRGPEITIRLPNAEGLEANQTRVRLLDVEVGMVTGLRVAPDFSHVAATVKMDKDAEAYMVEGTRFWVVRPRVGPGGVSGLATLLSGPYLAVEPGPGAPASEFVALLEPPPLAPPASGRRYLLTTTELGGISRGSGVYHRGLRVGQVTDYRLLDEEQGFEVDIFLPDDTADLVRANSRFWLANGIEFSFEGAAFRVEMTSLEAFLAGGVAFESPPGTNAGAVADGARFALYGNPQDAEDARGAGTVPFVAFFDGAIGGLRVGSPVLFRGVRIGRVVDVRFQLDAASEAIRAPVRFDVFERQVFLDDSVGELDGRMLLDALVARGMRARLATVNFVTGDLAIALEEVASPTPATIDWDQDPPVFPSVPGSLDQLQATLQEVLTAFQRLPLNEIGDDFRRIVAGAADLLNAPALTVGIDDAGAAAAAVRSLVEAIEAALPTVLASLEGTLSGADGSVRELQRTLSAATVTLRAAAEVVDGVQTVPYDTQRLIQELRILTRSLTGFVDYLERNPEALLRGRR